MFLKLAVIAALATTPFSFDAVQNHTSTVNAATEESDLGGSCPNGQAVLLNQPPNQGNGFPSDVDCDLCNSGNGGPSIVADDFVLFDTATIGQIVFWNGYFPDDQIPSPFDPVTVVFHSDTAGLPGAVLDSQTVVPTIAPTTGVVIFGIREIKTLLDIAPVTLPPGTYWVEIFVDSAGNTDTMLWEEGVTDATNGRDGFAAAFQFPPTTWSASAADDSFAITLCAVAPMGDENSIVAVPTLDAVGLATMVALLLAVGVFMMSRRRQDI